MKDIFEDEDFLARRNAARERLNAMNPHLKPGGDEADPLRGRWFDAIYDLADGDPANIPWARLAPNVFLSQWLQKQPPLTGLRALDVGCSLGDNAEALAEAGASVTAFDMAARAIDWAKRRFPDSRVKYQIGNLLDPPLEWRGAFDIVHECFTLQVLTPSLVDDAAKHLASFLAPSGRLLVIAGAREPDEPRVTSWRPLTRAEIEALAVDGLTLRELDDIPAVGEFPRHWRAEFQRA